MFMRVAESQIMIAFKGESGYNRKNTGAARKNAKKAERKSHADFKSERITSQLW